MQALREEQAQDNGEGGLRCPGTGQRGGGVGVELLLGCAPHGLRTVTLPCLLVVVGFSTQSRCARAAALP
jgi:hypothetical protein